MGEGAGFAMSHSVGHRCDSDLVWLWLWCRTADAALIRSLAWELLYAAGVALKRPKNKKKKERKRAFPSLMILDPRLIFSILVIFAFSR